MERALTILTGELQNQLIKKGVRLSHSQLVVIQALCVEEGCSASKLAAYLTKDRSAIKRTIDSLESKGYVRREKKDKKESSLYLTDAGKQILPCLQSAVEATQKKYFDEISPDSMEVMTLIFNHVNEVKAQEVAMR